ncbi:MAG TPA: DNA polymerase III subunit alpha, partial [Actinomycetota bacterium]|nr:DNA polymerase III subunit alpha [Actinomycetota bacterium]
YTVPSDHTLESYLEERAREGVTWRYGRDPGDAVLARLEHELRVIGKMGFAGYFLVVWDFIHYARQHGIAVGPGRGSSAGSLVAYCLGITNVDPMRYGLLFERFLNPERVSMPDFDIDFCQDGRDRVIDYVRHKYGAQSVSQIATFGTMAAKAVVRDVGRVLGMPYGEVDRIAKLVPFELGITLEKALEVEPQLKALVGSEEEVGELMSLARALEGLTRNVGMHAGGVIIAPGKLTDFTPLYCAEGSAATVSQFDKDDVEKVGLVKFDFLGLTTLTVLAESERNIRGHGEPDFDIQKIPLDDPAAYKVFSSGNTVAIFQFESRGMRDLIMKARPDRLEDLIALNALYRPGPMDLIPEFIDRKHGRTRWEYLDPRLKEILEQTYGVMTYQEQVMTIAQVIGGYTLGGADLLRRAMGKKKPEEMAKQREIFLKGAVERGLAQDRAATLFDQMEKFAGYGFNKSHSAAYALVAYQTAWLKTHHAAAFMAANMSAVMDDTDKVQILYDDAVKNGLAIAPPDVNTSTYRFVPMDAKRIRYGLGGVKGTGEGAIASIVAAREAAGPFTGLTDFCRRVDRRLVNRRAMEALV